VGRETDLSSEERYALVSLGDLVEHLVEGWRIDTMHYADRCEPGGPSAIPAAYFHLSRPGGARIGVYVPDDGRALSHHSLVKLFRESPNIWKHRSAASIPPPAPPATVAPEEWGAVPQPFPQALPLTPATLREVIPVNQIQSVDGLDVALVALERHTEGARLGYMCHASGARTRRGMRVLDVVAVDDAGRRYAVAGAAVRDEGNTLSGDLVLAPAIPPEVARLTVTVGTVAGEDAPHDPALGPWVFPISLAPR
jgi:hypothetical protein